MCLMYNYLHTFYLLSLSGHLLYIIMYIPYMYMFVLQVVDDPSGNSFVENPMASRPDPCMSVQYYDRDIQQDAALGIVPATVRGGREERVVGYCVVNTWSSQVVFNASL